MLLAFLVFGRSWLASDATMNRSLGLTANREELSLWDAAWTKAGVPRKSPQPIPAVLAAAPAAPDEQRQPISTPPVAAPPEPELAPPEPSRALPPLRGALIEGPLGLVAVLGSGRPQPKYVVLFLESLNLYSDSQAARSGWPLKSFALSDIQDIDVVEGGFDITIARQPLKFRALPGKLPNIEAWLAAFSKLFQEEPVPAPASAALTTTSTEAPTPGLDTRRTPTLLWQSMLEISVDADINGGSEWKYCALYDDSFASFQTPNDMAEGREPESIIPLGSIRDLELITRGFVMLLDTGDRINLRVGPEPGVLEAWVTNWRKVLDLSATSAGQTPQSQSTTSACRANLLK